MKASDLHIVRWSDNRGPKEFSILHYSLDDKRTLCGCRLERNVLIFDFKGIRLCPKCKKIAKARIDEDE